MKNLLTSFARKILAAIISMLASDLIDPNSGKLLGRALLVGWRGKVYLFTDVNIGPLVPQFLPKKSLNYWVYTLGFTYPAPVDYPHESRSHTSTVSPATK